MDRKKIANIILTGFMGCGKTTVGRILAEQLQYDFIDTDHLIEKRCKMSVAEIFMVKGERWFRQQERDVAQELSRKSGLVIATGGKLLLDPENVSCLDKSGHIISLVATSEEIYKRISSVNQKPRPLITGEDPLKKISVLFEERKPYYAQFKQFDTTGIEPEQVVKEIVSFLKNTASSQI